MAMMAENATGNAQSPNIFIPYGYALHDNDRVLCVHGPRWKEALSIIIFFATNYIAHAATVKSSPGDNMLASVANMGFALLFPMSGFMRALNAIVRCSIRGKSELEKACLAGALCMVVRLPGWRLLENQDLDAVLVEESWTTTISQDQDLDDLNAEANRIADAQAKQARIKIFNPPYAREDCSSWAFIDSVGAQAHVDLSLKKIHGTRSLPPGYGFAIVPRHARLTPTFDKDGHPLSCVDTSKKSFPRPVSSWTRFKSHFKFKREKNDHKSEDEQESVIEEKSTSRVRYDITSSYSMAKALASLVQSLAAFQTLLGHRDDLIQRWGYASFHLTVLPYLVMTVFNFISNIVTADFPCLYMVETDVMREARDRGGIFVGTVAAAYPLGFPHDITKGDLRGWNGIEGKHIEKVKSWLVAASNDVNRYLPRSADFMLGVMSPTLSEYVRRLGQAFHIAQRFRQRIGRPKRSVTLSILHLTNHGPAISEPSFGHEAATTSRSPAEQSRHQIHFLSVPRTTSLNTFGECRQLDISSSSTSSVGFEPHHDDPSHVAPSPVEQIHTCSQSKETATSLSIIRCNCPICPQSACLRGPSSILAVYAPFFSDYSWKSILRQVGQSLKPTGSVLPNPFSIYLFWLPELERVLTDFKPEEGTGNIVDKKARSIFKLWKALVHVLVAGNPKSGSSISSCDVCASEKSRGSSGKTVTIYIPNCTRFQRDDDFEPGRTIAGSLPGIGSTIDVVSPRSKSRGYAPHAIILELGIGVVTMGLLFSAIALLSKRFFTGDDATTTQKVIILLWMCEGTFGLVLPMIGLKEMVLLFIVLPFYLAAFGPSGQYGELQLAVMLAPLSTCIAPIWGFVIVGQMLTSWGQCVTLY